MKKLSSLALLATLLVATPAFADDTPSGVASDVNAVQKDNSALNKANSNLAQDRAQKAKDKANGNWGAQAADSVAIGGDKLTGSEKSSEKSADKKVLNNDVSSATTQ